MSPDGGSGLNNAMRDAAELGRLLSESDDWKEGVSIYELEMFERVLESARDASHGHCDRPFPHATRDPS